MSQRDINQAILDNLTTAVLLLDSRLRLSYINPAGEMLFAVSARQLQGLELNELIPGASGVEGAMRNALESSHPYTEHEMQLTLAGGRPATVDCTVTPLSEPGHEPGLLVELMQLDRHLRVTREENLIAQHNVTRTVVRNLAHEIKNPLGGLRGAAQLLERQLNNDKLKDYTRIIIQEADRLQNLMNRMLGPNSLPHKRAVNIHLVLEHVRSLVQAEAPEQVHILRDYDPSIPELHADPEQLIQAVLNIVRNAVQALGQNGQITLRSRTLRHCTIGQRYHRLAVGLDVIDDGPGIPPELQETLFYPMITSRPGGTGLGLSIAQSLVNQHGGLIECTSQPGHTVFTLLLPLEATDEQS